MFEKFKAAWKVKRGNDYERRKGKVETALHEVVKAAAPLEILGKNGNEGAQLAFNSAVSSHKALQDRMLQADKLVSTKPGDAYALLEDIKKQAKLAAEAAKTAREEKVFQDPSSRIQLDMGEDWDGDPPKVHPASIKGFENLSREEIAQATKEIGNKIKNGKRLLDDLLLHPEEFLDKDPELKEITDLMWYLRNKAEELVGAPFEKGALSLPDNGKLLRGYLDRCSEVYNRFSSHMKEQQKKVGGSARAVDFYEGDIKTNPDGLLPYGMNTMLVQSVTIDGTGEERLYVKLETESARLGAPSGKAMLGAKIRHNLEVDPQLQESRGDLDFATLPTSRERTPEDMHRTIEHGKNLIRKQKSRIKGLKRFTENEIGGNKDAVAKELLPKYEAIGKVAKKLGVPKDLLEQGNYKKEFHLMVSNLGEFLDMMEDEELDDDLDEEQEQQLDAALQAFYDYVDSKGMDQNAQSRVMTEAVLTTDFLKPQGLTAEKVAAELRDQLAQLQRRVDDELGAAKLQALANGARRSMQKAGNFITVKRVKDAADALQAETDKIMLQIKDLKTMEPRTAVDRLNVHVKRLEALSERAMLVDARDFPKSGEAHAAHEEARLTAFNIGEMEHLSDSEPVKKALKVLSEALEEFEDVIEVIEAQEEDLGGGGQTAPTTPPPKTTAPSKTAPLTPSPFLPAPAAIVYSSGLGPNPTLYFTGNASGGENYRVSSAVLGEPWQKVEQFCAYLATQWLLGGAGPGGLTFDGLANKDAAVNVVKDWAGNGGAAGQVAYASNQIGGVSVPNRKTVVDGISGGQYKPGTQIWFGTDVHAMAAVVLTNASLRVYDPNTGAAKNVALASFATQANVFVVKAAP